MPRLMSDEIDRLKPDVPEWQVIREDGMDRLHREFAFQGFAEALALTNRIGEIAEAADHHPRLVTEWGRVSVTWWSHSEVGLVRDDFEMAKKVDAL